MAWVDISVPPAREKARGDEVTVCLTKAAPKRPQLIIITVRPHLLDLAPAFLVRTPVSGRFSAPASMPATSGSSRWGR